MTSVPVDELIVTELVTRLERITTENEFALDVAQVVRSNRLGTNWKPTPRTIVVRKGDEQRAPELDLVGNPPAIGYLLPLELELNGNVDPRGTAAAETLPSELLACVRKALTNPPTNPSQWYTFGGLAIDAEIEAPIQVLTDGGEVAGLTVTVAVWYRISETNPYEARA